MGTKLLFQSGVKSYFKVGQLQQPLFQSGASVISNRGRDSYFKVGQSLFQTGAKVISKWGKILFQSAVVKWRNYFKVGVTLRLIGEETFIKKRVRFHATLFFFVEYFIFSK